MLLFVAVVVVVVNIWLMNSYTHFELVQINTLETKMFQLKSLQIILIIKEV